MFLRLLLGCKKLLHGETVKEKEAEARYKVLSCAQDIVLGVNSRTKWTPYHCSWRGRKVDLHSVLKYELMPVPVGLAEMNGSLRTGQKSVLADVITSGMNCPSEIELRGSSGLLIDGLALVSAIGRSSGALKRLGTLQRAFKQQLFKLDPAISKSTSYLNGIKKIPSSQEREKDAQSPLAISDVLLKMAMSLSLTVGQTSLHCQITSQI